MSEEKVTGTVQVAGEQAVHKKVTEEQAIHEQLPLITGTVEGHEIAVIPPAADHQSDQPKLPATALTSMTKADFATYAKDLSLESLVQNIHYCHQQAESSFLDAGERFKHGLEWAFGTGLFLIWIKEKVLKHGNFEGWVQDNCPFKERQAQRYMRLVIKWPEIQAKATSEDAFQQSVQGLLEFVAKEQTNPDEDAQQVSDADRTQNADAGADQDDSDEAEADQDDDDLVAEDEADQDEPEQPQVKDAKKTPAKSGDGAKTTKAERQIVNYKCGGTTKVTVAQHSPKSFLVTLRSAEPHDLSIELNRQSAEKLRQQLEAALAKTPGDIGYKKGSAKRGVGKRINKGGH